MLYHYQNLQKYLKLYIIDAINQNVFYFNVKLFIKKDSTNSRNNQFEGSCISD